MDNLTGKIKIYITEILNKNSIQIEKIILFGSRARGDNNADSDYDILVIIKNDIERSLKYKLSNDINQRLVIFLLKNNLLCGVDIIIKSRNEVDYLSDKIGSVTSEAIKEGILL